MVKGARERGEVTAALWSVKGLALLAPSTSSRLFECLFPKYFTNCSLPPPLNSLCSRPIVTWTVELASKRPPNCWRASIPFSSKQPGDCSKTGIWSSGPSFENVSETSSLTTKIQLISLAFRLVHAGPHLLPQQYLPYAFLACYAQVRPRSYQYVSMTQLTLFKGIIIPEKLSQNILDHRSLWAYWFWFRIY